MNLSQTVHVYRTPDKSEYCEVISDHSTDKFITVFRSAAGIKISSTPFHSWFEAVERVSDLLGDSYPE